MSSRRLSKPLAIVAPKMKTPMPAWAASMPHQPRGWRRTRVEPAAGAPRSRSQACAAALATAHAASSSAKVDSADQPRCPAGSVKGNRSAAAPLAARAQRRRRASSGSGACFQRATGPTPMRKIAGTMIGTNTASKYGGPTEIFWPASTSSASG